MKQGLLVLAALGAGLLLTSMLLLNALFAEHTTPLSASFWIHFIGGVFAYLLVLRFGSEERRKRTPAPYWAYGAGAFGGVLVMIFGITVNSALGVAGSIAMSLVGQTVAGWVTDVFGLFGLPKRRLNRVDFFQALCVLVGSGIIIYG